MVEMIGDEDHIWKILVQCLLSSQTPFQKAEDAADYLEKQGLLDRNFLVSDPEAEEQVREALRNIGLRYWRKNAKRIVINAKRFHEVSIRDLLARCPDEHQARAFFKKRVLGFGMKQASMFLRDIEYTQNFAIIDRHILRWMVAKGLINEKYATRDTISDSEYLAIERKFVKHAIQQRMTPGELDLEVWGLSARGEPRTRPSDE